jgi:CheY-like chemotaxis protein
VLVVDNEADARRVLERALESIGARVTTASSVVEALAVLADTKSKPDILLSDVGMPGQDGYDLIREMRRRGHAADLIPAVALTAFAHDDDSGKALAAGFQIHLAKPVSLCELASAVADLTGRTPKTA